MLFSERLSTAWSLNNSLLCVGLDPDLKKLPQALSGESKPILAFNKAIIDATIDLVCAYKPQIAYYAAVGAEDQLAETIAYIRAKNPQVLIILDAKRGDIGATAEMYATEAFDRYKADAVTVNPYMGGDTLEPFLRRTEKGVVILCRTSNPGAGDVQDRISDGQPIYKTVANLALTKWNSAGNVMLVVGATYPRELGELRAATGDMPFLVPGIGAQGGDIEAVIKNGLTKAGTGLLINSSRNIIFASQNADFAEAARAEAIRTNQAINQYR